MVAIRVSDVPQNSLVNSFRNPQTQSKHFASGYVIGIYRILGITLINIDFLWVSREHDVCRNVMGTLCF